jgi:hypothetical protein
LQPIRIPRNITDTLGFNQGKSKNREGEVNLLHWSTKFHFFFVPRGKISNPDSTFNAEFKYVSSFSPSPTVFFATAK